MRKISTENKVGKISVIKVVALMSFVVSVVFAGSFNDTRDGKNYKTVQIGNQVWMAENLNYEAEGSFCYQKHPKHCEKYGRLYIWDVAKNVCPSGWHLPDNSEFNVLFEFLGGDSIAGKKLKSKKGWIQNGNGVDEFGFNALPAGEGRSGAGAGWVDVGVRTYFWTKDSKVITDGFSVSLNNYNDAVSFFQRFRYDVSSIRCIQDSNE